MYERFEQGDDLKAMDLPEDEDLQTWEEDGGAVVAKTLPAPEEPESNDNNVNLQLRKFVGNNYRDDDVGRLRRGEIVTVSREKADQLLTVTAGNGRQRFREL